MKICIVGGVAGGASAATRLRRLDEGAKIVLLEKGKFISYANCGLPYYVGGVIENRDELLVTELELLRERFQIDVRTQNKVLSIDRNKKRLTVRNRETGDLYEESYDKLTSNWPVMCTTAFALYTKRCMARLSPLLLSRSYRLR